VKLRQHRRREPVIGYYFAGKPAEPLHEVADIRLLRKGGGGNACLDAAKGRPRAVLKIGVSADLPLCAGGDSIRPARHVVQGGRAPRSGAPAL
jgi:hypothetical protein